MLEYVLLTLMGCLLGVVTGLTPGLHANTVGLIGYAIYEKAGLGNLEFAVLMVAMSVTHTFIDFIPGIFLGVPEESTVLAMLPAHRLVMKGRGLEAVKLTGYGCLMGLVFGFLLLAPVIWFVPSIYMRMRGVIVYVLVAAIAGLIWREHGVWGKTLGFGCFILSGTLGLITLNGGASDILFPVFTGLFGLSGLLYSLKDRQTSVPQQDYALVRVDREVLTAGLVGAIGGIIVGVLPAMSPSQVGILMSQMFGARTRGFLVAVSAISASDSIYSLVSLYTINNARSGIAVMVGRIVDVDFNTLILFVGVFAFSAFFALYFHLRIGREAMVVLQAIDYRRSSTAVMLFLTLLTWIFTGWYGLLVVFTSTAIGLVPISAGVSRTHLMGVLLVPTILFFMGRL